MTKISMQDALAILYQAEINAGVSSFGDLGFHAWIGDKVNGFKAEADFYTEQMDEIGEWLILEALRMKPSLTRATK